MVYGTVPHVVFIHEIYDLHDGLFIVCSVTVNLDIEYMSTGGQFMIRSFDFCFVSRRAMIIYRNMIGIGVIFFIRYPRYDTECLAVFLCEFA